nr:MAG TPA: hypothetical protein [Caudoviricetes sp.]
MTLSPTRRSSQRSSRRLSPSLVLPPRRLSRACATSEKCSTLASRTSPRLRRRPATRRRAQTRKSETTTIRT